MAYVATYLDGASFAVPGDERSVFYAGRKVLADCGADGLKTCTVSSCAHAGDTTSVAISGALLTVNLASVKVGIGTESLPTHPHYEKIDRTDFNAHSILRADEDNSPGALAIPESTVVGRRSTGGIVAVTMPELEAMLTGLAKLSGATFTGQITGLNNIVSKPAASNSYIIADAPSGYIPYLMMRISGQNQYHIYSINGSVIHRMQSDAGSEWFQYYDAAAELWKTMARFNGAGSVELYHASAKRFETTENGIYIFGDGIFTGTLKLHDNMPLWLGTDNDGAIFFDGNTRIDSNTGNVFIRTRVNDSLANAFQARNDGAVLLFHNGSVIAQTTGSSFQVSKLFYAGHSDNERLIQARSTLASGFTRELLYLSSYQPAGSGFDAIDVVVDEQAAAQHIFTVRGDGQVTVDGQILGGGADRAEMFEWADGNPDREDRAGRSVVLVGDRIRLAGPEDIPDGVISANPDSVGNAEPLKWKDKYLRDELGRNVTEAYIGLEWKEPNREFYLERRPEWSLRRYVLNPDYDPEKEYIPRNERPEWAPVALLGRVRVWKSEPLHPAWRVLRERQQTVEVLLTATGAVQEP